MNVKEKNLLTVALLLLVNHILIAQIPNAGFENWAGGNPVGWQTMNGFMGYNHVNATSPGHSGIYAASGKGFPSSLSSTNTSGKGFTVNHGYSTLYFYYWFSGTIFMYLDVHVSFLNEDSIVVGSGEVSYGGTGAPFKLGNVPITMTGIPSTCIIVIYTGDSHNYLSSGLYVIDDLSFDYPVAISTIPSSNYFLDAPYPNPALSFTSVNYRVPNATTVDLKIIDLQGRQLKSILSANAKTGSNSLIVDLGDLSSGVYQLQMSSVYGVLTRKIIVSRF